MNGYLDRLNQSIDRTGSRIENLPSSVARFDSSVSKMAEAVDQQQEVLSRSLDTLTTQLNHFLARLLNYRDELDKVIAASDRQLELLGKRQALLEQELGRRSDLRLACNTLVTDSGTWQVSPIIENRGNAPSDFFNFFFDIPVEFGFLGKNYVTSNSDTSRTHVTFTWNHPIGFLGLEDTALTNSPSSAKFEIVNPPPNGLLSVTYTITYQHGFH